MNHQKSPQEKAAANAITKLITRGFTARRMKAPGSFGDWGGWTFAIRGHGHVLNNLRIDAVNDFIAQWDAAQNRKPEKKKKAEPVDMAAEVDRYIESTQDEWWKEL